MSVRDRRRQYEYISCEEAAADASKTTGQSVRSLRVAEVATQGIHFGTAEWRPDTAACTPRAPAICITTLAELNSMQLVPVEGPRSGNGLDQESLPCPVVK